MLEPQEVVEIQMEEKTPVVVKESRLLPPAGELLTRRLPVELVGDTIQVSFNSSFAYGVFTTQHYVVILSFNYYICELVYSEFIVCLLVR